MADIYAKSVSTTAHDATEESDNTGKFVRTAAGYREIISKEHATFKPESGRYHLYISYACPWANRCLAVLKMKGLEQCIGVTVVHPTWQRSRPEIDEDKHNGWAFYDSSSGVPMKNPAGFGSFVVGECEPDTINGAKFVRDLYEKVGDTLGKYSVPVLWDKVKGTIVNNESSEIIRMFTREFDEFATGEMAKHDFYPPDLRAQIDAVNEWVYPNINDGVYKCGFAKSQSAYDEAVTNLFDSLERVETILAGSRYLVGNTLTEADIRLFMTLVRFDEVYVVYFKTNKSFLRDFPQIREYMRDLWQTPGLGSSVNMQHIKTHYFTSHPVLNAYAVIPQGPNAVADFELPHTRARFST